MWQCQDLISDILLKTFFCPDPKTLKAGDISLSKALAEFTTQMFDRARSGVNLLTSLLVGEVARNTNFSQGDRKLHKLVKDIRSCMFAIIQ